MKLFCDNCSNRVSVFVNVVLMFKCDNCFNTFKAEDDDSLLYEKVKNNIINSSESTLEIAKYDNLNVKEYNDCPKCKHHISDVIRIGADMRAINRCEKCDFKWIKKA